MKINTEKLRVIALFLVAALSFRVLYLYQFSASPLFALALGPDVEEYHHWAKAILGGNIFWENPQIHAPVYPFFLAILYWLFSFNYMAIRFFQLLLNLIPAILIYLIISHTDQENNDVRKKHNPKLAGIVFLIIYTFYPPLIFYQAELISESLIGIWLTGALYCFFLAEKNMSTSVTGQNRATLAAHAGAGLFSGLAAITHPLSLFFIAGELFYLSQRSLPLFSRFNKALHDKTSSDPTEPDQLKNRHYGFPSSFIPTRSMVPVLVYICCCSIPIIPVSIYNSYLAAAPVFIQKNSGFNFFLGNNPQATGSCYLRPGPEWDKIHQNAETSAAKNGISKDSLFLRQATSFITHHPWRWLALLGKKALMVMNYREFTAGADVGPIRYFTAIMRYGRWSYALLAALGLLGVFSYLRQYYKSPREYRHFFVMLGSFWLALTLMVVSGRYRIPLVLCLMVFASYAISLYRYYCEKRQRLAGVMAVLTGCFCLTMLPLGVNRSQHEQAEAATIYGEAYYRQGKYRKALAQLRISLKDPLYQQWSRTYNLIGINEEALGHLNAARANYQKALTLATNPANTLINLASLYLRLNKPQQATKYLEQALQAKPNSPKALYSCGRMRQQANDLSGAESYYLRCLKQNPAFTAALNNLGIIKMIRNDYGEATKYFSKAVLLDPGNAEHICNLALACYASGNRRKAHYWAEKAVRLQPTLEKHPAIQKIRKYRN